MAHHPAAGEKIEHKPPGPSRRRGNMRAAPRDLDLAALAAWIDRVLERPNPRIEIQMPLDRDDADPVEAFLHDLEAGDHRAIERIEATVDALESSVDPFEPRVDPFEPRGGCRLQRLEPLVRAADLVPDFAEDLDRDWLVDHPTILLRQKRLPSGFADIDRAPEPNPCNSAFGSENPHRFRRQNLSRVRTRALGHHAKCRPATTSPDALVLGAQVATRHVVSARS